MVDTSQTEYAGQRTKMFSEAGRGKGNMAVWGSSGEGGLCTSGGDRGYLALPVQES